MVEASDIHLCYVTCPDADSAQRLGRAAVEARLAACANWWPGMRSCYRWNNAIEESDEVVLLLKTTEARVAALEALVAQEHPDEVPCWVSWPLGSGHGPFVAWLREQTS